MNAKRKVFTVLGWVILIAALIIIYLPIALVILYSFINSKNVGESGPVSLELYKQLFENEKLLRRLRQRYSALSAPSGFSI